MAMQDHELTVVYNDTCPICAREVNGYRRMAAVHGLDIGFVGLSDADLEPLGLTRRDAARRLHVLEHGQLSSGVDAFATLWERMPRLRWLARLVRLPGVRAVARLVYDHVLAPLLFAMHRRRERLGKARKIA